MRVLTFGVVVLVINTVLYGHVVDSDNGDQINDTSLITDDFWIEDDYEEREHLGIKIYVHKDALETDSDLTEDAYDVVVDDITWLRKRLMIGAFNKLVDNDLKFNISTLCNHWESQTAFYNPDYWWYSDFRAKSITYCKLKNLLRPNFSPRVTMHEVAHAFHDLLVLGGFYNRTIIKFYNRVVDSGQYDAVNGLHTSFEKGRKKQKPYYLTNHREYFAVLSEALFLRSNYEPFCFFDVFNDKMFTDYCDDEDVADDIPWSCETYPNSRYNPVWTAWWWYGGKENGLSWYYETLDTNISSSNSWVEIDQKIKESPPPEPYWIDLKTSN